MARSPVARAMIISDSKQFVFIHNPKCAGTTLRWGLVSYDTTGLRFARHETWNGYKVDTSHLPLFMLQVAHPEYFKKLETYFTFMVVRNPFTRFLSAFNEANQPIYDEYIRSADISRYRYEVNRFATQMTADVIRGWDYDYRHFVQQADFAYVGRKNYVDVIIRFENLKGDLDKIAIFDTDVAEALRRAVTYRARPVDVPLEELLDPATVRKLLSLYEKDFLLFDYEQFLTSEPTK